MMFGDREEVERCIKRRIFHQKAGLVGGGGGSLFGSDHSISPHFIWAGSVQDFRGALCAALLFSLYRVGAVCGMPAL